MYPRGSYNPRMRSEHPRLFLTLPHTCGYFGERNTQNLVIDPAAPHLDLLYPAALANGFRRAGNHLYRPRCPTCHACVPCRIPVNDFQPDRSQRRCLAGNAGLAIVDSEPGYTDERFDLYQRYLHGRHLGGGMDDADADDFEQFLYAPWSNTRFIEMRAGQTLLGVAVTDQCTDSLSAVYTFFDPREQRRGLGTRAILAQIDMARRTRRSYLYLGFWIHGHPKMDYKRRFRPLEILKQGQWRDFASS